MNNFKFLVASQWPCPYCSSEVLRLRDETTGYCQRCGRSFTDLGYSHAHCQA